jgi:hypothetical protein
MMKLETTNPRITQFYKANPSISFEAVNLIFVDLFEKLLTDMNQAMNSTVHSQLLCNLSENNHQMGSLASSIGILQDTVKKMSGELPSTMISSILDIKKDYIEETKNIVSNNALEIKSSLLLQNVQQPIYSFISATEDRIHNDINSLKENTQNQQVVQTKILSELDNMFHKFRTTRITQQICDRQITQVLTKLYTTAEISNQSGAILLKRQRKTNILIDNKDAEDNVSVEDINRFISNTDEQHCNGIFISQQSGISTKKNYQIEIHNNNILVFVHNAEYSSSKIEIAVDIIDNISSKMRQFKPGHMEDCAIPKEILDTINNEYQTFISQKAAVVEVFKESQKKVLTQIDEFRFPALDKFLSTKYSAPIQKPGLKCDLCKSFCGNNLKALAAHKRGCARKNTIKPTTINTTAENEVIV